LKGSIQIGASYKKHYRMNVVGKGGATTTVAIPPEVIDRKAEQVGLRPEEFVRRYKAVAHYDNFDGVFYAFERVTNGDEQSRQHD
jgi:hypothetical protein